MTQANKKGMWLRPAEQIQSEKYDWIANTVASLLTYTVLVLPFAQLTGFGKIYPVYAMLLVGVCLCVLHGILSAFERQGAFYPGILTLMLIMVIFFRQQIMEGFGLFWNQLGDTWTASTGWVLPELDIKCAEQEHNICLSVFSVLIGAMGSLLCCAAVSAATPIFSAALPGLVLIGYAVFEQPVESGYLILVLITSAELLLCSGWGKKKPLRAVLINGICFALIACLFTAIAFLPAVKTMAAKFSLQLHENIHVHKYETIYTTLPEGDFTDYEPSDEEAKPALIVTMEHPEAMYLRGFTGAVFDGESWTAINPEVLAEHEDLLYWLNINAFHPSQQFESAIFNAETAENQITVQNVGACSRYYYLPFTLATEDQLQNDNLNADSIESDADRIYTFSVVSGGTEMLSQVLEFLQSSDDTVVLNYRKAESAYREFVYSYYLQIPQEAKDMLVSQWAGYGEPDNLTSQQIQACVMDFLNKCFVDDEAELPLAQAKDSSYQYATVAALTLRYFGIPSRYAEGYIITEEMAAATESGESIEVDSTCASAWVEVYQDGIGWIPMDLTAGMGESAENTNQNTPNSDNLSPKEGQELEEEPEQPQDTEEPDGGYMTNIPEAITWGGLMLLLILLLLVLMLLIRRKIVLSRKERTFQSENCGEAIAWIFADTVLLLEKLGFDRGNGSVRVLCDPIRERFGDSYAAELTNVIDLNAVALFSSRSLTEEQRMTVLEFRENTLQLLQAETKWNQRLRMKWIECLF